VLELLDAKFSRRIPPSNPPISDPKRPPSAVVVVDVVFGTLCLVVLDFVVFVVLSLTGL